MIHILCVHVGTKYSVDNVNRLYRMVKHNLSLPFRFFVYSDVKHKYQDGIQRIPFSTMSKKYMKDLPPAWYKICMINDHFGESLQANRCVYFDLDVVIQNKIDDLCVYRPGGKLCVIHSHWKSVSNDKNQKYPTLVNSSVMSFEKPDERLDYENLSYYVEKYGSTDRYIDYHLVDYNFFPRDWFYSRAFGNLPFSGFHYARHNRIDWPLNYAPKRKVCIFNSICDLTGDQLIPDVFYHGMEIHTDV